MNNISEALRIWNPWWNPSWSFPKMIPRNILQKITGTLTATHIKDIIGVRRCGKTVLMQEILQYLIQQSQGKVLASNCIFINFDDPIINSSDFEDIYNSIFFIQPNALYLFLDEVQEKANWERWVRTLYDTHQFKQIFISGSNTSLLSQDIGRVLTGRHLSFSLWPFSFEEYLIAHSWDNLNPAYLLQEKAKIFHYFDKYLFEGGFPESFKHDEFIQRQFFTNIYNDILIRDIVARHQCDLSKIQQLGRFIIANITQEFSYRKIGLALNIHPDTIEKYLSFFEESFFIGTLNLFSYKQKIQFKANKKIYIIDTGLRTYTAFKTTIDKGKLVENLVYLELRRQEKEIYYWKNEKGEVDFLITQGSNVEEIIQVCWDLASSKTKAREIKGILLASALFDKSEGLILTESLKSEELHNGIKIRFLPVWQWLLGINN